MSELVAMLAPDGTPGYVPQARVQDAISAGGKIGVGVLAPDGTRGVIPQDRVQDAVSAGGQLIGAPTGAPVPSGLQGPPSPAPPNSLSFGSPLRYGSNINEPGARGAENEVVGGGAKSLAQTLTLGHSPFGPPTTPAEKMGALGERGFELVAGGAALRGLAAATGISGFGGAALRTGAEALNMGANAAVHGEDPLKGAAIGAAGGIATEALAPIARGLVASATGTRALSRAFGRTPEATILADTSGFAPAKIAQTARDASLELTSQLETAAQKATTQGSMKPALDVIDGAIARLPRQNVALRNELQQTRQLLTTWQDTGQPIGQTVDASTLLDLKRGIGNEIANWNPNVRSDKVQGVLKQVYRALDGEFDRAVPEVASINQRVSTLIAVADDATRKSLGAGITQNVAHRVSAHTGALASSVLGGEVAGIPGAIAAPIAQEVISAPAVKMFAARGLDVAGQPGAVRGAGALVNAVLNPGNNSTLPVFLQRARNSVMQNNR